ARAPSHAVSVAVLITPARATRRVGAARGVLARGAHARDDVPAKRDDGALRRAGVVISDDRHAVASIGIRRPADHPARAVDGYPPGQAVGRPGQRRGAAVRRDIQGGRYIDHATLVTWVPDRKRTRLSCRYACV